MIRKDQLNQEKVRVVNKEKIAREKGKMTRPPKLQPEVKEEMTESIRIPTDKNQKH